MYAITGITGNVGGEVARANWESLFRSQGVKNPTPRIQILDGLNEGWIEFEGEEANVRKGSTHLETVLQALVDRA